VLRLFRVPHLLALVLVLTSFFVTLPDEAAQRAVAAISGAPAESVIVAVVAQEGAWSYGTAAVPGDAEHDAPDVYFYLAHDSGSGWIAEIRFTPGFSELLAKAPGSFPTPDIRATLDGFTIAGDGSADMAFPFPVGQAWQFNGPHPNSGSGVWSSLDFYPSSLGSNAPVVAMRGGVVYRPCANMVMIDHGDGWTSHYYHVINYTVSQGQTVIRGQQIGGTSDQYSCGGYATGPHVHVYLKYQNREMAIAGMDIGGWTVENGSQPYNGCLTRDGERLCPSNYDRVLNEGASGSGGSTATAPASASVSPTRTTVNSWITYTLRGYPANSTVQITWRRLSGSTIDIGTGRTDGSGNATGRFRVPATPGGPNQQITFAAGGTSKTVKFEVAPRIKVNTNPGVRGQQVDVSLRGYSKQESVRIRWKQPDGSWVELARVTTSNTGSANVWVTVPSWAPDGNNSVRGDGAVFRQQTNVVRIQGGSFQAASIEAASPTATATTTATPVTIDASALPTGDPLPIMVVTDDTSDQPVTVVTDQDPATAWQVDPTRGAAMLTVDLGTPATVSAIAWLEMQEGCGAIDRIETSLDGENWQILSPVIPVADGEPGVWQVLPANGDARYVRWVVSAVENEPQLGCLAEVAIWGRFAPTPEPTETVTEPPVETEPAPSETVPPTETVTPDTATEAPTEEPTEAPVEGTAPPAETTPPADASEQSGEP
jgi:murein DD-endopeptidase MepM/ murein hydrolase activator NlpD